MCTSFDPDAPVARLDSILGSPMGPLSGIHVLEFAGIGPVPMCGMLLADMGATVLRIERPTSSGLGVERPARFNFTNRSRRSVVIDLKRPQGIDFVIQLVQKADALIEGFRPGTMERIGLGPQLCLSRNPRLVYGRLSGWGQDGPLAKSAGHDLNYIALSGALHAIGRKGHAPTPPLNLVGDYGGGALYLALGVLGALLHAVRHGQGQTIDCSVLEGATSLMTSTYGLFAAGIHNDSRGTNVGDSGAPYYDVYSCSDGKFVAIAAIEAKFRAELFAILGIDAVWVDRAADKQHWDELRKIIQERLSERSREEWSRLFEGSDACFSPVVSMVEAPFHPHNVARGLFVDVGGVMQPAPAPRFSRTVCNSPLPADEFPGQHYEEALNEWDFTPEQIDRLRSDNALVGARGKT